MILQFIRRLSPWIFRLVGDVANIVWKTLQALVRGVLPQCQRTAIFWTNEAIQSGGIPNSWAKYIYPIMYGFTLLTLVVGWMVHVWLIVIVVRYLARAFF
ncbi:MAG: hypothetical protein A2W35_02565 [Chloroflexi bacterium RBG_16_57_11]|nr:MAG: hypothetical protein A2W35_02565 [Chloroflexi bacterium RBG_16_57_11]